MPGPQRKAVDEGTTLALINAFETAVGELSDAERTVLNSSTELGARWLGNASLRYQEGLREISGGLVTIRGALRDISGSMNQFAGLTQTVEDDNAARAASVTLSSGTFTAQASWTE